MEDKVLEETEQELHYMRMDNSNSGTVTTTTTTTTTTTGPTSTPQHEDADEVIKPGNGTIPKGED